MLAHREASWYTYYSFITVFISKFVELHGVLLFQNKHICLAIYGPQCESLISHLQVRMNEAEMLYFYSKLPDPARGTNSEHLENVLVLVWAYKIKCTCFDNNFCPSLLVTEKGELTKTLGNWRNFSHSLQTLQIIVLT